MKICAFQNELQRAYFNGGLKRRIVFSHFDAPFYIILINFLDDWSALCWDVIYRYRHITLM